MLFQHNFGIDLGSDTVKIYAANRDAVIKEKNMIAVMNGDTCLAVGNEAYEMYEKTPQNVQVSTPLSDGKIADITYLEIILQALLKKSERYIGRSPHLYFTVPTDTTEIERRAYHSLARAGEMDRSRVYLVYRPIADAIALGIPIKSTKGEMIVNIGAQSTEISVIADQRVIISRVCPIGGVTLDEAIVHAVRKTQQLFIGKRTATRLKTSMGDLFSDKKEARMVMGVSSVSGLPKEEPVARVLIRLAAQETVDRIAEEIMAVLERTPPQVRGIIQKEGFHLLGGSSALGGIDRYLADKLSCPVLLSRYSDEGTITGLKEILQSKDLQKAWAFPAKRTAGKKPAYR